MIDVIKQMVEALEWCHGGEPIGTADAIAAGKKLIAELESQEPVAWRTPKLSNLDRKYGYRDFDDPVIDIFINKPSLCNEPLYTHPPQRTEPKVCCQVYDTCLEPCTPRGTHLAQRTWVGLTEQEQFECMEARYEHGMSEDDIPQIIEAKLKEKNT